MTSDKAKEGKEQVRFMYTTTRFSWKQKYGRERPYQIIGYIGPAVSFTVIITWQERVVA
jgi:hypothetical protein